MYCPFCNACETKVTDSRLVADGQQIRRRRECLTCGERFTTYEAPELILPRIIKREGAREDFNEEKLRSGMLRALEKRPVSMDAVEASLRRIIQKLRASGERELSSQILGEWVMEELHQLDDVAYVRFASVYRSFQDINAFLKELKKLEKQTKLKGSKT